MMLIHCFELGIYVVCTEVMLTLFPPGTFCLNKNDCDFIFSDFDKFVQSVRH